MDLSYLHELMYLGDSCGRNTSIIRELRQELSDEQASIGLT